MENSAEAVVLNDNEIDDCTSREAHSCNRYHELRPGNKWSHTSLAMGIQGMVSGSLEVIGGRGVAGTGKLVNR